MFFFIFVAYVTIRVTMGSLKNVRQFGPAVWSAKAIIYLYMREELCCLKMEGKICCKN